MERHTLGGLEQCEHCHSWNFAAEAVGHGANRHFSICCSNGKTKALPAFDTPGPVLRKLLEDDTAPTRAFRDAIRSYNAALAFISVGATVAPAAPPLASRRRGRDSGDDYGRGRQ